MIEQTFRFKIKELGVRKRHVVVSSVFVPDNWQEMDDDDFSHFLTMPDPNGFFHVYHGGCNPPDSPFEKVLREHNIFGSIYDFSWEAIAHLTPRPADAMKPRC